MARTKPNAGILTLPMAFPWSVSVLLAGLVYGGLHYVVPGFFATKPLLVGIAAELQQIAGVVAFVILLMAPLPLVLAASRYKLVGQPAELASIRAMPWQGFEKLCGEVYRRQGFAVQEHGERGTDGTIEQASAESGGRVATEPKTLVSPLEPPRLDIGFPGKPSQRDHQDPIETLILSHSGVSVG